ncbi:MAG TPA: M20/M25/M40 family metallo-hydrolase [Vicinamibacterales bacterium]|jgi:acetylornithine deacetylase/succinyl-diaminopimelate desuccinylase-like protein|nr:M20/M25/M40 family metallo-hydrolase [Vicinamibacterales bacterium]
MRLRVVLVIVICSIWPLRALAQTAGLTADQQAARDILRELIEINTSYKGGSTAPAVRAIADRFLAAGFPAKDVSIVGPQGDKDPNLVIRMAGSSAERPLLLLAHLDVVEALRADWSMDPYTLNERDGFFYGRGTADIKDGAATLIAALLRLKRERVTPTRTLILALTAGEEGGGGYNGVSWLIANHRDLIDAELCLNVDGGDPLIKNGKRVLRSVQSSEKLFLSFRLEVTNAGGHSSMPSRDNAIYHLAAGLDRLAAYEFPVHLNETTRAYFAKYAALETGQTATDMRTIAIDDHDDAAARRLSASPFYNAQLRTTCVATMLEAGHAENALPQTARATVNCRNPARGNPRADSGNPRPHRRRSGSPCYAGTGTRAERAFTAVASDHGSCGARE